MFISRFRRAAAVGLAAVTALSATACSGSSSSSSSSASSALPSVSADSTLVNQVPEKFKTKGTLQVGTNATFAPIEFMAEDGKTIVGLDADLSKAVASKLGLQVQMRQAEFGTIILGVTSGKFDMGASGFTINSERIQQVNMVQYMKAGLRWAVQNGNPKKVDVNDLCGRTVSVQRDTVSADQLAEKAKACTDAGKAAITQVVEDDQSKTTTDLNSGKSDAMLADSPIVDYAIEQSNGSLEALGDMYDAAPYGIVLAKGDTDMANLVSKALASLKQDGIYQKILDKWGNSAGGVDDFAVNPTVS
ncbi:ABC transporter substrate-binding protein [Propionibacterium freudenreichii]|uniref:ABC transporter substrate-binding protein n=1 Tax=Propionibacterium freudenreichii TaxID=1744 RepID=UPI0007AC3FD2|nr:ABC transporter substrate-binding protein [Propionibacterium freudenreichii]CUW08262.1 ABC transporter substrate-binding protein [Propionibacterium freudenreichii subsp. shermanii]SPB30581.1 Glutamine-binding periplasmic protein [Propionibacterium freudenreichii subsp. shermanii]SPS08695.1 Glutamine-binding periplasmic protein [Propionibacterium freudenreichii subsp. shermanii]